MSIEIDGVKYWVIMEDGVATKVAQSQYIEKFGTTPTETDNTKSGPFEGSTFGGAYSHTAFADTDSKDGAQNNKTTWTSDIFLSGSAGL